MCVVVKKATANKQTNKQIITKQSIFLIQGLPAIEAGGIAKKNWFQVGNEDLNSSALQILNIHRDIEWSL